jgi:hypothetical protein
MLIYDVSLDCTSVTDLKYYYFRNGTFYGEVLRWTVDAYGECGTFFYDDGCRDVFWDVMPCSLVETYHCLGETRC